MKAFICYYLLVQPIISILFYCSLNHIKIAIKLKSTFIEIYFIYSTQVGLNLLKEAQNVFIQIIILTCRILLNWSALLVVDCETVWFVVCMSYIPRPVTFLDMKSFSLNFPDMIIIFVTRWFTDCSETWFSCFSLFTYSCLQTLFIFFF